MSSIALDYGDSLLYQDDIQLLEDGCWLNDKLISFCFEYYTNVRLHKDTGSAVVHLCGAEVAQLIKLTPGEDLAIILGDLDLKTKDWIFFPLNDNMSFEEAGGSHWSLLLYSQKSNVLYHYDSLSQHNLPIVDKMKHKIANLLDRSTEPDVVEGKSPQQKNGYDCGMYVIEMSLLLLEEILHSSESASLDVSQLAPAKILQARRKWKDIILGLSTKKC